ncbi:phospholipase SGR2 isoform X2 [Phalaenopsis equestris]|uniref:phospholipase SGR2 isoform X2 n=1 Tax=Phalaenopsis equestris TaxID=78828 RepID=UPI0009E4B162|nr:phospholipase SGR2 isoform X2 [Phalaenopsis equestris]
MDWTILMNNSNVSMMEHENSAMSSEINQVETSPDLLKNTPSNIARLEDLIEQCKGRQKYRAQTRSPSDGENVRWYFCKIPLAERQLAASVPLTEVVGKSDYFRFSVRDSLALEVSFLQREEDMLSYWWKEFAECSEGPHGSYRTSDSSACSGWDELYVVEEERVGVPVKGGLYEVDLFRRHSFPVYWNGENRRVLRGHWFARKGGLDWFPVREDLAEQLEFAYRCQVWHRRTFQPSGQFAARVDLQGVTQGLHALFTGEDDTWEAWLNFEASGFSLGQGSGIKLRRGFQSSGSLKPTQDERRQRKEEEMDDYCSQVPVGHLVFMVHGIGQRLEKANLVDDVGDFRRITASLAERHLTAHQRGTQRVLLIPCQWRKGLKLSGESAVDKITLDGVRSLRVTLSATAHDVLYYMSPIYCQYIIDSVSNQLNKLYAKFMKRNPHYNGKVSLYGHSLGSVLSYDILCHQECSTSPIHQECSTSPIPMDSVHTRNNAEQEPQIDVPRPSFIYGEASVQEIDETKVSCSSLEHHATAPLPTENFTDDSLKPIGFPIVNDESLNLLELTSDKQQYDNTQPLDACDEKSNTKLRSKSCTAEIDSNALFDSMEESPGESGAKTADLLVKDVIGKDNLISLLREEVKSLQIRNAELEQQIDALNGNRVGCSKSQSSLEKSEEDATKKSYTPYIRYTKLDFKVDTFFAVGSPLGVFLSLRNIRIGIGKGQDYWQNENISEEMPCCRQMFNIFHPFDPVAYRVEPLICKEYVSKRPVIIPYHRGGKRLHIGLQEFSEDVAARSQAMVNSLKSLKVKMINVFQSKHEYTLEVEDNQEKEQSYGAAMIERLIGHTNGRIDHVLQSKTFQHPYILALGSHTNYWRDPDTVLFILKHLYRDIPESLHEETSTGSSHISNGEETPFYEKDFLDEDFSLTFSDPLWFRDFCKKSDKAMPYPSEADG